MSGIPGYGDTIATGVCLATKDLKPPDVRSKRFLGHKSLEDLYAKLEGREGRLSPVGRMFLEFMEENQMAPVKPFNKTDLRVARRAFGFAEKSLGILSEMKPHIEPQFRKLFKSRASFTRGRFSPTEESAYSYASIK